MTIKNNLEYYMSESLISESLISESLLFDSLSARFKEPHFYSQQLDFKEEEDEIWYKIIDSMQLNFSNNTQEVTLESKLMNSYETVISFESAVSNYLNEKAERDYLKDISEESVKNFLYLLPTIDQYLPNINIDADTGYINSVFNTKDNGILNAIITGKGEIHYSRVSKGVKIYKISGVVKIKDSRDFHHFSKVLEML